MKPQVALVPVPVGSRSQVASDLPIGPKSSSEATCFGGSYSVMVWLPLPTLALSDVQLIFWPTPVGGPS